MDALKTRRHVLLENIKAIAALSVSAAATSLLGTVPAQADPYGEHGGDRYSDRGGDRYGDRGGDRYGDRGGDRYSDRGGDRYSDRGSDRYGDRGGDRYGDRGSDRYGDRGGDRYGDRGSDRYGDRGGDRYGDRGSDRYGDRGGDRYGDRGGDRYGDNGGRGDHDSGGHNGGHGGGRGGACFLRGTRIRTVDGQRCIEDLKPGDLLPTHFNGPQPIQRIAHWRYIKAKPRATWKKQLMPVRIAKSALAHNVPHRDLYLTQGHALFVDGLLIPAGVLVNGATITLHPAHEDDVLDIFNIKLEQHDIIYAEGAPCETLLRADRTSINFAKYLKRFGAQHMHCAPIYCNGRLATIKWKTAGIMKPWIGAHNVDVVRKHLAQRAETLPRPYVSQQGLTA
jgi:hypothetical protein